MAGTRFKGPSLLELEAESDALTRKEEAAKKANTEVSEVRFVIPLESTTTDNMRFSIVTRLRK